MEAEAQFKFVRWVAEVLASSHGQLSVPQLVFPPAGAWACGHDQLFVKQVGDGGTPASLHASKQGICCTVCGRHVLAKELPEPTSQQP